MASELTEGTAELPEGYYLDNVVALFEHVESLYEDILPPPHLTFLRDFALLGSDAKKLYIRMLNRSHYLFRTSKLNYPEIGSIREALDELESHDFLEVNPDIERRELIALFSKNELLARLAEPASARKLKRSALDTLVLERVDEHFYRSLARCESTIRILQKDSYELCQMLFFGNLNQSMTDFVLRDLGLHQYEKTTIDTCNRPFASTLEIDNTWRHHQLETLLDATDPTDVNTLQSCFDAVPECSGIDSPLYRKGERLKCRIARQCERLGNLDLALNLYHRCRLPPSRERIARVLNRQGQIDAALQTCESIIDKPLGEEESQFANAFGKLLIKRHKVSRQSRFDRCFDTHEPQQFDLVVQRQDNVEAAVVDYYLALDSGNQCYFLENSLFNGVLGLLIWDAVFAPISGAFYNPFQYRPADFYSAEFQPKRAAIFTRIWSSVTDNETIWQRVSECWRAKVGLMNPLVNWNSLSLEIIELALQRIEYSHWISCFERILLDLRTNRAGFPDLVLFPAAGGYLLVEVKGPGDSLQKNQRRWMDYFALHDIPHAVARVRWCVDE